MLDQYVIFHSGVFDEGSKPELDFRTPCSMLPVHSIAVGMVQNRTVVLLGSPEWYNWELLEYAADLRGIPASEAQIEEARSGRVYVFELDVIKEHAD